MIKWLRMNAIFAIKNGGHPMKKLISLILCCALVLALAGCAGTTVVVGECTCPPEAHTPAAAPTEAPAEPVNPTIDER